MLSAVEPANMIGDIFRLHACFPKKPGKAFRRFDGKTAYGVHPTLAAMLFIQEELLPEDFRIRGCKALLGHDLIEDTLADLPDWCLAPGVIELVRGLTFEEGEDSFESVWSRSDDVILLKLYDATINLMNSSCYDPEKYKLRLAKTRKLTDYVEIKFGPLNIIKIARGLLGR